MSETFIPSILQIDSIGIGVQYSNISKLDMTNYEYVLIGERANNSISTNSLDTKYNFIVNSDGVAINSTRRMYNNINSNFSRNAGLYITNDIITEGKIIAKGLELEGITLSSNINSNVLVDLINKINQKDPLFYRGLDTYDSNIYGYYPSVVDNIYTTSFLTIGSFTDTFSNNHPLNIVETANNSINSVQLAIQNDINNDIEPAKFRLGIIGDSSISPSVISTTTGMPLEFHISKSTQQIDNLYRNATGFPEYNSNTITPSLFINENGKVGINTYSTSDYNYTYYYVGSYNEIKSGEKTLTPSFNVYGTSYIDELLTYDYYTNSVKNIDDIFVRQNGLSIKANQIKSGDFNRGIFTFNSNLNIGKENDNFLLSVNGSVYISSNLNILNNTTLNTVEVINDANFYNDVSFSGDINIHNDLLLSNCLHLINGDIFYNGKRLNIVEVNFNNVSSNVITFSNSYTLNVSGSNLAIPGKLGVGVQETDSYTQQFNVIKRDALQFEIMLEDYSKSSNINDSTKVYIGHNKGLENVYSGIYTERNDNSLIFFTQRNVDKHNIYFYAGKDLNRSLGVTNQIPNLSINQENKVGINTNKPEKELDVVGDVICNDYYIKKSNNINYKTIPLIFNNTNNTIYLYDDNSKSVCININYNISQFISLKGLNVKNGINSLDGYYDNNTKIGTFKYYDNSQKSIYTNNNVFIGWKGENTQKTPLQVRNINTTDNNNSIIRIYRGIRGGGFNNQSLYSGLDICEYETQLSFQDRDNYKWFLYKFNTDDDITDHIGPLIIGYTDGTYNPKTTGITMYYNKYSKNYHIDINNKSSDVNYSYNDNVAMTINGDLNVLGNINIIDKNNNNYNYKINNINISSNIINNLINNTSQSSSNQFILSKDDIAINGEKIIILPNNVFSVGFVDNWYLQYIQTLDDNLNQKTPFIVYQKTQNNSVANFMTTDDNIPNTSTIELGIFNTKKNYNGDKKNTIEFKVLGYNEISVLEFNTYNYIDQSLRNLITFYNNYSKNYISIGSYSSYNKITGIPITTDATFHINDDSKYLLQLTNHITTPVINMQKINQQDKNDYWLLSGPDVIDKGFSISYGFSDINSYEPANNTINNIINISKDGNIGINNNIDTKETFLISSVNNLSSLKLVNNYNSNQTVKNISVINIVNSNLRFINDTISSYSNYNFNTGYEYTISISNLPNKDINNNTLLQYYLETCNIIISNVIPITSTHNITTPLYYSNLFVNSSNLSINFKNLNIFPNFETYTDISFQIPEEFITRNNLKFFNSNISIGGCNVFYNYSNTYTLPTILLPSVTTSISSNIVGSNVFVRNIINNLIPLSSQSISYNRFYLIEDNYVINNNFFTTSNLIWFNNVDRFNLGLRALKLNRYRYNSVITVPTNIYKNPTQSIISTVSNNSNISINSTIDFLNPIPSQPTGQLANFSSYLSSNILLTSNYTDTFVIYNQPQTVRLTLRDSYFIYNFRDYIKNVYLNAISVFYTPHITLQNKIQYDDTEIYKNTNIHKIFSYNGDFSIYLDTDFSSDKVFNIDKSGNIDIRGNLNAKDLTITGKIYDNLGNDILPSINTQSYNIRTNNYILSSSNIIFDVDNKGGGILINGYERNFINNIFQINGGKYNSDGNLLTLFSYTDTSYIHLTSRVKLSYNTYTNKLYRFGLKNDIFGLWKYNLNDVENLPGGYIDGKLSSSSNYTPILEIDDNINFNKTLNLNTGYLKIGNNSFSNIDNNLSYISHSNINILTFTSNNIGILNQYPDNDYSIDISGSLKVSGDVNCLGNVISSSDIRYKTNIKPIENALDKLLTLTGITYENILIDNEKQTGLIAQEVLNVLPEAVKIDKNDNLSIAYGNMAGLIVQSIKELKKEIDFIKTKINIQ